MFKSHGPVCLHCLHVMAAIQGRLEEQVLEEILVPNSDPGEVPIYVAGTA